MGRVKDVVGPTVSGYARYGRDTRLIYQGA